MMLNTNEMTGSLANDLDLFELAEIVRTDPAHALEAAVMIRQLVARERLDRASRITNCRREVAFDMAENMLDLKIER